MIAINPSKVLYIKLGEKGVWERECIEEKNTLRLGYRDVKHEYCINGEWDKVEEQLRKIRRKPGVAKKDVRQIKNFYTAGEDVLWITFYKNRLWWCFSKPEVTLLPDRTKIRPVIDKWKSTDVEGEPLLFDRLSGYLLSLQGYRGTICEADKYKKYIVEKINGEEPKEIEKAKAALNELEEKLAVIIRRLHWKDFETLIDLIFRQAGWQRVSRIGGEQKTFDLDLRCPITGNRYLVQVKSRANRKNFEEFQKKVEGMQKDYTRFYFIVHSPFSDLKYNEQNETFELITVEKVAQLAIEHGLANWVIKKAY